MLLVCSSFEACRGNFFPSFDTAAHKHTHLDKVWMAKHTFQAYFEKCLTEPIDFELGQIEHESIFSIF